MHVADLPEKLRVGQTKAIEAMIDYFDEHDRGILWMCCGSGKTVACAVNIELRSEPLTVVFTPYIHLVKQWRRDYLKWLPTTQAKFMLVCSEKDTPQELDPLQMGKLLNDARDASAEEFAELVADVKGSHGQSQISTDPKEIATFLKQKGRKVVFCTYASAPVYGEAQRRAHTHANYGVLDEAHWTASGDNITESTFALHDENVKIDKRLFTTATVRHYRRSGVVYSMDNKAIYGNHVLVDENGEPDPWTLRQAIEHREVAPYRIVVSFVTDPTFDPKLAQLPPYRELLADIGDKAEPDEVLRRIGQVMALERLKEKYGVKKPLGFFSNVTTARLSTDILNKAKKYPQYFPYLSKSDPAVSVSAYEPRKERERRIAHLHNSHETEINNSKLFIFGASEDTIDGVFYGDPMTSNTNVIQGAGRALRYVEDKVATIAIPAMLPYYGNDLESYAKNINRNYVHDAYEYLIDILDSLAEMDPLLRDQMTAGGSDGNGKPGIIEFDFPEGMLPKIQTSITVEVWKEINPETDFTEKLYRDRQIFDQYLLHMYPLQQDPHVEAEYVKKRATLKTIPQRTLGFEVVADRMSRIRRALRSYHEANDKADVYGGLSITKKRSELIYQIYDWDKDFVLRDEFQEALKEDRINLEKYRLQEFPSQNDLIKEAEYARERSKIKIIPHGTVGFEIAARRMGHLYNSLKAYHEANDVAARYTSYRIDVLRAAQIYQIYGWDKEFVLRDEFEESLIRDKANLDEYRQQKFPPLDDSVKEAKSILKRDEIKILPFTSDNDSYSTRHMWALRKALKLYYLAGEKEGTYAGAKITKKREQQILQVFSWDRDFVFHDQFEQVLKEDALNLEKFRFTEYPVLGDPQLESKSAQARAAIKIIPLGSGDPSTSNRMYGIRKALRQYYEAGEKPGRYGSYVFDVDRVLKIFNIYGWDRDFVMSSDFDALFARDIHELNQYKYSIFPRLYDLEKEKEAEKQRAQIRILPAGGKAGAAGYHMWNLRKALRLFYNAHEKAGSYGGFRLTNDKVQQVLNAFNWDVEFVLRDDFEALLKNDMEVLKEYRVQKYPIQEDKEKEQEAAKLRAEIKILPSTRKLRAGVSERMASLRRAINAYFKAGELSGKYDAFIITADRVVQVFAIYQWDKEFVTRDNFKIQIKRFAEAISEYRFQKYPLQSDASEEAKFRELRSDVKILPDNEKHPLAKSMAQLRRSLKDYYGNNEQEDAYDAYRITRERAELALEILGWDRNYVARDEFIENLKQDALALAEYRLLCHPIESDSVKEAVAAELRSKIRIIPSSKDYKRSVAGVRMNDLRRSLKAYFEADNVEATYGRFAITAERVQSIMDAFGWDKDFIMFDKFEETLKIDKERLEKYRFELFPSQDDPVKEAEYENERRAIFHVASSKKEFRDTAVRMQRLCGDLKRYHNANNAEGSYEFFILNADRVERIYRAFGWTREYVYGNKHVWSRKNKFKKNGYHMLSKYRDPLRPLRVSMHKPQRFDFEF